LKEFKKVIFLLLIIILLSAVFWVYFLFIPRGSDLESFLPSEVDGLMLHRVAGKDEAMATTVRSHRGEIKDVDDMVIGYYDGGLSIWVTKYSNSQISYNETIKMIDAMKRFEEGFEEIKSTRIKDVEVYVTEPGGEKQYFWSQGKLMVYIIPGALSESESRELISDLINDLR